MQAKIKTYADSIHPLVEKITRLCQEHDLPMLMAFCLDRVEKEEGKMQMTVAGSTYLPDDPEAPQPMIFAASMLQIPGFKMSPEYDLEGLE